MILLNKWRQYLYSLFLRQPPQGICSHGNNNNNVRIWYTKCLSDILDILNADQITPNILINLHCILDNTKRNTYISNYYKAIFHSIIGN